MKNTMTKAGVAALFAATAAISAAQSNGPTGYSVRIGAFFPNSGSSLINVGLDYKLNSVNVPAQGGGAQPAYVGLTVDYYGNEDASVVPLAVTYNVRASQNFVLSAGIGPQFVFGGDETDIEIGAQVGAAYEFATQGEGSNPIFVQAKYFFGRTETAGFAVSVGYRF